MVHARPVKVDKVQQGIVELTGGINEEVTTLQLGSGELIECENYFEVDGPYGGYVSCPGYEVFDGSPLASEIPAPYTGLDPDGEDTWDDTDRELRRSGIQPLPGTGQALGVHQYMGDVYGQRDTGVGGAALHVSSPAGWVEITGTQLNEGGRCDWVNENFSKFPTPSLDPDDYPPVMVNKECMFWVDGVSKPHAYDGTNIHVLDGGGSLPCDDAFPDDKVYPEHIVAYDNRLWISFPGGHLFRSELGDPAGWDGKKGAGSIPCGDEITDLIVAPGDALVVLMRNSTKILYKAEEPSGDFMFQLKEFSTRSGAFPFTASRMFGDIYFIDDRGPTTLKTVDAYGDFKQNALTRRTQRTFNKYREFITCAVSARDQNHYRLFFNNGTAIYWTFHNKKVKGAGIIRFDHAVRNISEAENSQGAQSIYFTADDDQGYIYKMDSGTSFNGEVIRTKMVSAYYHYNSPRSWKHFIDLQFEITSENGSRFSVATDYDYRDPLLPGNASEKQTLKGIGGRWGEAVWGQFIWGGAYVARPIYYVYGYGTNMAVCLRTEDKYRASHIIHNFITEYTVHDRRV